MPQSFFDEPQTHSDPFLWFDQWMDQALASSEPEPTAMSLATLSEEGQPTVRIVLLKSFDRKGFVFYTNLASMKARHLQKRPVAGLNLFWKSMCRQVRIDGAVELLDDAEADAYFASRPRGSQIGAWASRQSQPLASRQTLQERVESLTEEFDGAPIPRPPFWSGYRVVPQRFEFWQLRPDRLHDRWEFLRQGKEWKWKSQRLYP